MKTQRQQQGFTILEVVMSIFFVSIVFVGLALAQVRSLKSSNSMALHTEAVTLQKFIADRILVNALFAKGIDEDDNATGTSYDIAYGNPGTSEACDSSSCTPAQIANYDRFQWKELLAAKLPNGDGQITNAPEPGGPGNRVYTIEVEYEDFDTTGTPETRTLRLQFQM